MSPDPNPLPPKDSLPGRLRLATRADLDQLCRALKLDPTKYSDADHSDADVRELVEKEFRSAAGHTLMNLLRRRRRTSLGYKEILVDVADKLTPGFTKRSGFTTSGDEDEAMIEDYIFTNLISRIDERLKAMSDVEKKKLQEEVEKELQQEGTRASIILSTVGGVATGSVAAALAGPVVAALVFTGLRATLLGVAGMEIVVGGFALGGPIGILAGLLMFLWSPGYSKTIPAVCRLISIRLNDEARSRLGTS
jgi:uncharacterized protein YaaW (UPF0174 family)